MLRRLQLNVNLFGKLITLSTTATLISHDGMGQSEVVQMWRLTCDKETHLVLTQYN